MNNISEKIRHRMIDRFGSGAYMYNIHDPNHLLKQTIEVTLSISILLIRRAVQQLEL